ncbi:hypothetical protein MNBD_GAMMA12-2480 [hydrothermal vent metagenome]|uniref:Uncharacterized protein n=1 Tax=hydrothermal vent metagenome TaxID=652676 RepID=A0A3B0Z8Q5_9ZZZZ
MATVGQPTASCKNYNVELVHFFSDGTAAEGADYILTHPKGTRKGKIGADGTAFEKEIPEGKITVKYTQTEEMRKLKLKAHELKRKLDEFISQLKPTVEKNRKLLQENKLWDTNKLLTADFLSCSGQSKSVDPAKMIGEYEKSDEFFISFYNSFIKFDIGGIQRQLVILYDTGDIEREALDVIYIRIQLLSKNKKSKEIFIAAAK